MRLCPLLASALGALTSLTLTLTATADPAKTTAAETSPTAPAGTAAKTSPTAETGTAAPASATAQPATAKQLVDDWTKLLQDHDYSVAAFYPPLECKNWSRPECVQSCKEDGYHLDCKATCSNVLCGTASAADSKRLEQEIIARWDEVEPLLVELVRDGQLVDEIALTFARGSKGSSALTEAWVAVLIGGMHEKDWLLNALKKQLKRSSDRTWLLKLALIEPPTLAAHDQIDTLLFRGLGEDVAIPDEVAVALVRRYHGRLGVLPDERLLPLIRSRLDEGAVLSEKLSLAQVLADRIISRPEKIPPTLAVIKGEPEMRHLLLTRLTVGPGRSTRPTPAYVAGLFSLWAEAFAGPHRAYASRELSTDARRQLKLCERFSPGDLTSAEASDGLFWLLMQSSTGGAQFFGECDAFQSARWEHWLITKSDSPSVEPRTLLRILEKIGRGPLLSFAQLSRPLDASYQEALIDLTCDRLEGSTDSYEPLLAAMLADIGVATDDVLAELFYCARRDTARHSEWARALVDALPRMGERLLLPRVNRGLGMTLQEFPAAEKQQLDAALERVSNAHREEALFLLARLLARWVGDGEKGDWQPVLQELDSLARAAQAQGVVSDGASAAPLPQSLLQARELLEWALRSHFSDTPDRDRELKKLAEARLVFEKTEPLSPLTQTLLDSLHDELKHWEPFVFSF